MSEAVIVALITSAGLVAVAAIGAVPLLLPLARRIRAIQQHVENDHRKPDGTPLNLRDDLDTKHEQNHRILLAIQRDVMWLARRVAEHDDQLTELADTLTKERPT